MTKWKTIETAPTDGTPFLGFFPKEAVSTEVVSIEISNGKEFLIQGFGAQELDSYTHDECDWPTHWISIPDTPRG